MDRAAVAALAAEPQFAALILRAHRVSVLELAFDKVVAHLDIHAAIRYRPTAGR
jgi:hypothetical protein